MVHTFPTDISQLQRSLPEKRVSLHVDWDAYQTIRQTLGENPSAHLTYYNGILEIMTPLEAHENSSGLIGQFIEILTEELNLNIKSMESTTLDRPGLKAGAEPDQGYYIANEPLVRGKTVDLNIDPPPDLVVEVDITHTDINKNLLYAELGVPEFWRYNGKILQLYELKNGQYQEVQTSPTFPDVPKEQLYEFLSNCAQQGETQAKRDLRVWIRKNRS
ncbi:Uma2 family endonuclease [Anabaena cylindrica UHCC 0172]|uniref:Uma2 family endonuclease n=1 Tax=Anabaena cylindrica TaxID=1165 RepID=UPI002B1FFF36|nr:Uma2 family endonuclease [Anabaena cylindrica]MEA5550335.1 Uma2 family endonuclease [Anabaena cylindrica UHCC 0172]